MTGIERIAAVAQKFADNQEVRYGRNQNRGSRSDCGRHSGAGIGQFQLHQGDSRSQDRPARIVGQREGDDQHSSLGWCGSDSSWRNPAFRALEEVVAFIVAERCRIQNLARNSIVMDAGGEHNEALFCARAQTELG